MLVELVCICFLIKNKDEKLIVIDCLRYIDPTEGVENGSKVKLININCKIYFRGKSIQVIKLYFLLKYIFIDKI